MYLKHADLQAGYTQGQHAAQRGMTLNPTRVDPMEAGLRPAARLRLSVGAPTGSVTDCAGGPGLGASSAGVYPLAMPSRPAGPPRGAPAGAGPRGAAAGAAAAGAVAASCRRAHGEGRGQGADGSPPP